MAKLDQQAQRELQQFIEMEQQKARFQASVHNLTEMCFDKCISKPGGKLDKSEEACLAYCVDRFLDTSALFMSRLSSGNRS